MSSLLVLHPKNELPGIQLTTPAFFFLFFFWHDAATALTSPLRQISCVSQQSPTLHYNWLTASSAGLSSRGTVICEAPGTAGVFFKQKEMGECRVVLHSISPYTYFVTAAIVKPFPRRVVTRSLPTDWHSLRQGNDSTQSPCYHV